MALGAQPSGVLGMILQSSMSLVVAGMSVGVLGALALAPLVSSILVGISPRDPVTFVLIPILMLVVTAIASLIPALRATRVEPVTALRYE